MKKQIAILSITACVLVSVFSAGAQTKKVALPWGVAVRGNVIGNVHENVMSYFKHRRFADLVTAGFSVDGMYDFTKDFPWKSCLLECFYRPFAFACVEEFACGGDGVLVAGYSCEEIVEEVGSEENM